MSILAHARRGSPAWRAITSSQKIKVRICGFQFHVIMTDVEYLLHNGARFLKPPGGIEKIFLQFPEDFCELRAGIFQKYFCRERN
jgi:hypothetical protein